MKLALKHARLPRIAPAVKPRISVCHVVAADMWAGAEAQIAMLLAELSQDPELSLCAIALGEGRLADELRVCNIDMKVISQSHRHFTGCYREASDWLRGKGVQVIHSHKSKENILALLLAKKFGIRHIVRTQHGLPEPKTLKDRAVYCLERMTSSSVSRVICVSSDLRTHLCRYANPRKIEIIRNAISLSQVKSALSREAAKRRLGIPEQAPVIGTAARLEPVKRLDLFLAAAQHISAKCICHGLRDPFFVIAGEGSERTRMEQLICGTVLESRTRFLGHRDDIYDVMRAMDLLLITSDHEGLPTVALEAMALGTPVASRKVGGIPEVVDDQVNGVLVDSSDPLCIARACLPVLTEGNFAFRLTQAARQKVTQHFSAEANAAEVARIYRALEHCNS